MDRAAPGETGVFLYGLDGHKVEFKYYDPNIDAALFPLLFPYGQRTYETGIPLKTHQNDMSNDVLANNTGNDSEHNESDNGANSNDENEEPIIRNERRTKVEIKQTVIVIRNFPQKKGPAEFVSSRQFYRYLMQIRGNVWQTYHWLWWALNLAQIYCLTVYNRIEANEANEIKKQQKNLVSILPEVLVNFFKKRAQQCYGIGVKFGKIFFAPKTFRGSRRYYQKAYADSQAIIRAFGSPHVFVTFTLNSEAPELVGKQNLLNDDETWADRPEIVIRIFDSKIKELMKDLLEKHIFGHIAAWFGAVEFQKR